MAEGIAGQGGGVSIDPLDARDRFVMKNSRHRVEIVLVVLVGEHHHHLAHGDLPGPNVIEHILCRRNGVFRSKQVEDICLIQKMELLWNQHILFILPVIPFSLLAQ